MIGGVVPIKQEIPFRVLLERNERQGRAALGRQAQSTHMNSVLPQDLGEKAAKLIVTDRANEAGSAAEASCGNGYVGRSAAGGHDEARRAPEWSGRGRDKIDQQFAEANDIEGGCNRSAQSGV